MIARTINQLLWMMLFIASSSLGAMEQHVSGVRLLVAREEKSNVFDPERINFCWSAAVHQNPMPKEAALFRLVAKNLKAEMDSNQHMTSVLLISGYTPMTKGAAIVIAQALDLEVLTFSPAYDWASTMSREDALRRIRELFAKAVASPRKCMIILENVDVFADVKHSCTNSDESEFWRLIMLELQMSMPSTRYVLVGIAQNKQNLAQDFTRHFVFYDFSS